MDLLLIVVLTLLLAPLVAFTGGAARIVVGLVFVLFSPGYALITALFPMKAPLGTVERIALSFGLSIAVVPLIVYILNYTPWGIRLNPILFCITLFIVITSLVALYRRWRVPKLLRFEPHLRVKLPTLLGWSRMEKAFLGMLLISMIVAVVAVAYVVDTHHVGESFTEFYIVGPEGMAEDYPQDLAPGEEGTITLVIVNHEHQVTDYFMEIEIDGEKVQEIGPISLVHGQKWEAPVTFAPNKAGEHQKVEFLLHKINEGEAYQKLHLWLDVKGAE